MKTATHRQDFVILGGESLDLNTGPSFRYDNLQQAATTAQGYADQHQGHSFEVFERRCTFIHPRRGELTKLVPEDKPPVPSEAATRITGLLADPLPSGLD